MPYLSQLINFHATYFYPRVLAGGKPLRLISSFAFRGNELTVND